MFRNKYFYILTTVAIATGLLLIKTCKQSNDNSVSQYLQTRNYIDPPFEEAQVKRTIFEINASEGAELDYGTTKISVPQCAFLNAKGEVVDGSIELGYREVRTPVSILLSGVPMELEEGTGVNLESVGMLEMVAFQGEEELKVNPNCLVNINMQSNQAAQDYNLYNLDVENRKWVEDVSNVPVVQLKREVITKIKLPKIEVPNYAVLAVAAGLVNPVKPVKKKKELFQFKFKTDFSQFPELNIYNGVQWEFAGAKKSENPAIHPWVTTTSWYEMKIVKRKKNGTYTLHLAGGGKEFNTTVRPVFDEQDMEYAQYMFDQKYTAYRGFIDKKKEEAKQWKIEQERIAKVNAQKEKVYELTNIFSRQFKVSNFGWANLDRIYKSDRKTIAASFVDKLNQPIIVDRVYLMMDSVNSILTYYNSGLDQFTFNPYAKNSLVIIDSLANAYIVGQKGFEPILSASTKHQFELQEPVKIRSERDVERLISSI